MEDDFKNFVNLWGSRFERELKNRLAATYSYAPGFNGDAYSNGRNPNFGGSSEKIASGSLYNSIQWVPTSDGFVLLMNRYWEWVNYGRQPGKYVPIRPLEEWATLKGFDNPRGAAFAMSKNIQKFGIAPTYFYDDALDILESQFNESLEDQFGRSFQDFLDNIVLEDLE